MSVVISIAWISHIFECKESQLCFAKFGHTCLQNKLNHFLWKNWAVGRICHTVFWRLRLKKEENKKKLFKIQSNLMFSHKNSLFWFHKKYFTWFCSSFPLKIAFGRWRERQQKGTLYNMLRLKKLYLFLIWHREFLLQTEKKLLYRFWGNF